MQADLVLDDLMPEQRIELLMLNRIDTDQKQTAKRVDAVEKSLREIELAITGINAKLKPPSETPWWIKSIIAPVCVGAILATAGAVIHLEMTVSSIQGSLAKQTITTHSTLPPSEFKATLPDLASSIALARKRHVKVPTRVVDDLTKQLTATDTNTSGFWPAAAQLISYRSTLTHEDLEDLKSRLPRCVDLVPHPATTAQGISPGEQTVRINPAYYENCQFRLDSPEEDEVISSFAQRFPALTLRRCLVIYNGGEVHLRLGMWPLMFENCLWNISVSGTPPASGQKVTETLLANNPDLFRLPAL